MKKIRNLKISSLTHFEAGQLVKSNLADVTTAGINQNTDPLIHSSTNPFAWRVEVSHQFEI